MAVASNNKVELLTCSGAELVAGTVVRAHTRVVTDLAWHTYDSQLLATSSADNYIYLWDMRDLRRPKAGLQAVQGAAKLEWNRVSGKGGLDQHQVIVVTYQRTSEVTLKSQSYDMLPRFC